MNRRPSLAPLPRLRTPEMDERMGWVLVIALVTIIERHLKHADRPMLSHAVWRSPVARAVVLVFAVHLLDHRRRLARIDPVSWLGRWL